MEYLLVALTIGLSVPTIDANCELTLSQRRPAAQKGTLVNPGGVIGYPSNQYCQFSMPTRFFGELLLFLNIDVMNMTREGVLTGDMQIAMLCFLGHEKIFSAKGRDDCRLYGRLPDDSNLLETIKSLEAKYRCTAWRIDETELERITFRSLGQANVMHAGNYFRLNYEYLSPARREGEMAPTMQATKQPVQATTNQKEHASHATEKAFPHTGDAEQSVCPSTTGYVIGIVILLILLVMVTALLVYDIYRRKDNPGNKGFFQSESLDDLPYDHPSADQPYATITEMQTHQNAGYARDTPSTSRTKRATTNASTASEPYYQTPRPMANSGDGEIEEVTPAGEASQAGNVTAVYAVVHKDRK